MNQLRIKNPEINWMDRASNNRCNNNRRYSFIIYSKLDHKIRTAILATAIIAIIMSILFVINSFSLIRR